MICNKCKLVQVSKEFDLNYMYDDNYGYRTGINHTMTSHVKSIVNELSLKKNFLNKGDYVLDIASNDATLSINIKNFIKILILRLAIFFQKKDLSK